MFTISHTSGLARDGTLKTSHALIATPFFMPVATKGTVKYLDFGELEELGTRCIISNALLLSQRPGIDLVKEVGGLHRFYGWKHGIFTDSGGFQSLDGFFLEKATHEGAYFRSPFDGKTERITPERAMEIQIALGSDVAMCLDDVPKADDNLQAVRSKTLRTHAWAKRCKEYHDIHGGKQLLFGIAQGGTDPMLRAKSAAYMTKLDFDGIALGGLAIGEPVAAMREMIAQTLPHIPSAKPRYLMGVGSPEDLLECIGQGVDCFDSTFPTQNARHQTLFTWKGKLRLDRKEYSRDLSPIDEDCGCRVCRDHTRAYLQHLFKVREATAMKLATYHNLYFIQELMTRARTAIEKDHYREWKEETLASFRQ
jgi:queuine tRNA-ribosyltransferase